jgi:hypothetical protein
MVGIIRKCALSQKACINLSILYSLAHYSGTEKVQSSVRTLNASVIMVGSKYLLVMTIFYLKAEAASFTRFLTLQNLWHQILTYVQCVVLIGHGWDGLFHCCPKLHQIVCAGVTCCSNFSIVPFRLASLWHRFSVRYVFHLLHFWNWSLFQEIS